MSRDLNQIGLLPIRAQRILEEGFSNPPKLALAGMPLEHCSVDHVAIALQDVGTLKAIWYEATECGATTVEAVHRWPDGSPGCESVPESDKKWMCTIDAGGLMFVLLAPQSENDVIASFIKRGGEGVHHIAFNVPNIHVSLSQCLSVVGVRQITVLAEDRPLLSQVFLKTVGDDRITELVTRGDQFRGTFTCRNIAKLTEGERQAGEMLCPSR